MPKVLDDAPPVKPPAKGTAYWFKMPYDAEDSVPIRALISALRNPNAAMYAVRLWQHAARRGAVIDTPHVFGTIEGICRWTGKFGRLATALLDCGFLQGASRGTTTDRDAEGRFEIVPWNQLVAAEWQGANLEDMPDVTPEDRMALKRAQARIRSQRRRDAEASRRDAGVTGGVTPSVTKRDGGVTKRDENGPTRARETKTETQIGTEKVQEQVMAPAAVAAVPAPEGKPVQEPLIPEPPKAPRKQREPSTPAEIDGERWRKRAYEVQNVPYEKAGAWPKGLFLAFRRAWDDRGIDVLMQSLDGLSRLPASDFNRKRGWTHWMAAECIDAGLAALSAPNAPTASRGAFPTPGVGSVRMPRNDAAPVPDAPAFDWTPAEALIRARARPAFAGPPTLFVPWGKSLPDDFQIPDDVVVEYLPDPGPKPLTFHDIIRGDP